MERQSGIGWRSSFAVLRLIQPIYDQPHTRERNMTEQRDRFSQVTITSMTDMLKEWDELSRLGDIASPVFHKLGDKLYQVFIRYDAKNTETRTITIKD